jgi:predicted transcriptional regulator
MAGAGDITNEEFDAGKVFTPLQKTALAYMEGNRAPHALEAVAKAVRAKPDDLREGLAELADLGLIEAKTIDGRDFFRIKPPGR